MKLKLAYGTPGNADFIDEDASSMVIYMEGRDDIEITVSGKNPHPVGEEIVSAVNSAVPQIPVVHVFSADEVANLDAHQNGSMFHPFTCPSRGDGNHREMGGDLGALIPTVRGWICPFCDYTQGWAHDFMKG